MRIQLTPANGGRPIELERELTVIGRQDECDLKLEDKSVSKLHCVLFCDGKQVLVRDLGSTNGTRVNGQRIRRSLLATHDQLSIAGCVFRVTLQDEATPVPPRSQTGGSQGHQTLRMDPIIHAPHALEPGMEGGNEGSDSVVLQPLPPARNPLPDHYPD